jgi:hypothetical protein
VSSNLLLGHTSVQTTEIYLNGLLAAERAAGHLRSREIDLEPGYIDKPGEVTFYHAKQVPFLKLEWAQRILVAKGN